MSRGVWVVSIAVLTFLTSCTANADTFSFSDFSSTAGLTLNGSATPNGNALRLTPDATYQIGSAFYTNQQSVQNGFTTTFQFQLTHVGNLFADGIWFQIQNSNIRADSQNVPNSLDVEFDDFQNIWDPNANHVAVLSCGTQPNSTDHSAGCTMGINPSLPGVFSDGNIHSATVAYTPGSLAVSLDGTLVLTTSVDLATKLSLNNGNAWVGFVTSTGEYSENNDILNWSFQSPSPVPEPSTFLLLGCGLSTMLGITRLQKRR